MSDWLFNAPGGLSDFSQPRRWHEAMAREARDIVVILAAAALEKDSSEVTDAEVESVREALAYADPTVNPPPETAETVGIQAWGAFPRAVMRRAPWKEFPPTPGDDDGIYRAAEHLGDEDHRAGVFVDKYDRQLHLPVRDRQDEYLEWAAERNGDGELIKLSFVAEGYDYFSSLFEHDEGRVLDLYKQFTGLSDLKVDDLRAPHGIYRRRVDGRVETVAEPGGFNPRNRYNIKPGIVHLSHRANSLGAEVNLAGVSGIARRKVSGEILDGADSEQLLCCNQGGNPNRNSDPLISQQAYRQVLERYRYTLADPVGLYIASIEEQGLLLPDNKTQVPRDWWREVRGTGLWNAGHSRVLRLELSIPSAEGLTISDLLIGGQPVKFAGQVAELLNVHLFVTRWLRDSIGPIVKCDGTCCVEKGTERLVPDQKGLCEGNFELKFPELVPAPTVAAAPSVRALVKNASFKR